MTRRFGVILVGVLLAFGGAAAHAGLAIDEATYPGAGGDYNNLLSPPLPVAVVFGLEAGTNTFAGTFGTPGDAGDTFVVQLDPSETLTRIDVTFATNAGPFDPVAINQGSQLVFDLTSSNQPTPLVLLNLTGRPDGPVTFSSGPLSFGAQLYSLTMLTGVLALNDSSKVGYQVAFDVSAAPVPEPATSLSLLLGLGTLAAYLRLRRR